jgi:hypothetical protein
MGVNPVMKIKGFHTIVRTSPKGEGEQFIGRCISCGKTGITLAEGMGGCDNPMPVEEALIAVIEGVPEDKRS